MDENKGKSVGFPLIADDLLHDGFDASWVRRILNELVLKQGWTPPSQEDVAKLAHELDLLKQRVQGRSLSKKLGGDLIAIAAAFRTIDSLASPFIQECWSGHRPPHENQSERLVAQYSEHLLLASQAIAQSRDRAVLRISYGMHANKRLWKGAALELAGLLAVALAKNNPGRTLGYSSGGPASRWVHLVIPKLTSEMPSLETVSALLKSEARTKRLEEERRREKERLHALLPPPDSDSNIPF